MRCRALFLDFDGVILSSPSAIHHAWKKLFHTNTWNQEKWETICHTFVREHGISLEGKKIIGEMKRTYLALQKYGHEYDPSLLLVLAYCREKNIPVAIGSHASRETIRAALDHMKVSLPIDCIIGRHECTHRKPDPEVWIQCSEATGVPLTQCCIVDNNVPGLIAAKKVGARSIYYY